MGDLSEHFSRVEFSCRCGCGFDAVAPGLVDLLERTRSIFGRRMVITSGCRCAAHNRAVGGSQQSQHLAGRAADIHVASTQHRHALVAAFLQAGASGVGVAKGFVHGDVGLADADRGILRPALWTY
jgi:uncharacterized protein YcbK (DUF882 family)